jgi:anti-sigma regulatory factor (Ser/Thr protein kinase)
MEVKVLESKDFSITAENDVYYVRRQIRQLVSDLKYSEYQLDQFELIISELGTNILKYGIKGNITARKISYNKINGVEIIARDNGEGLKDIFDYFHVRPVINLKDSLKAGISTIYNLSDEFEYANQEKGVRIQVRKWESFDVQNLRYSVVSRPKPGENLNGDAFFVKQLPYYSLFSVIDGLGHGEEAHTASNIALDCMKIYYSKPLEELIQICHEHLRGSRGVVMSICKVFHDRSEMEYIGIGNVELRVLGQTNSRLFNWNGTLGMQMENGKLQKYPYLKGSTFVMYSDGIKNFELDLETQRSSPQNIARYILDNYVDSRDDATVLVIR